MSRSQARRSQHTVGLLYGFLAYAAWGLFPLVFALLDSVSPVEVVAHRVLWSFVFLCVILTLMRGWPRVRQSMSARSLAFLAAGSIVLAVNWTTYVYAVEANLVVEASLGYFINPLVSVALAVIVLGERLRRAQWAAVAIGLAAVIVLTAAMGHPPWISLILALSFGSYGLFKKQANVGAVESLTIETAVLLPVAIVVLALFWTSDAMQFARADLPITLLLIMLGPITALPLIAFGAAATRVPLSSLGLLQYGTPVLQFLLGLFVFHENMSLGRWIGFVLVWIALVIFSVDTVRSASQAPADELAVAEPD